VGLGPEVAMEVGVGLAGGEGAGDVVAVTLGVGGTGVGDTGVPGVIVGVRVGWNFTSVGESKQPVDAVSAAATARETMFRTMRMRPSWAGAGPRGSSYRAPSRIREGLPGGRGFGAATPPV